jgi:isoquinoline 1-oxidoreductase beta subunit
MRGFDTARAETMPGVERIVDMGNGVAVVARNTWLAQQAVDAIDIDWGDAPSTGDTDALFERIAASFDGRANSAMRDDGDADTLPEGATEITAEYKAPYLAHATMEPMNATALFTGDALSLWCGNQSPIIHRDKCAAEAGLSPEAVEVHTPFLGGGFGRRAEFDAAVYATRVAKAMPGVPVQLTWSREEDMRHDFYRPGAVARYRGAVRDGRAVLLDARIAAQSPVHQIMQRVTGFPGAGPDKVLVDGAFNQPYAIPNQRVRGYVTDLDIPVGFWRSVGCSHNGFFHETFIDEMAHAAGRDPLEFRIEMAREEHAASAGVLEAVGRMCGWTGNTPEGVGRGVAFTYSFGTPVAQVVEVADEDGAIRIRKAWIACDTGLALDRSIIEAQMSGGMIFGLSAAMQEITFSDGGVDQGNFPDFDALRMHSAPEIEVAVLESGDRLGGAGEPGTPPALPALGNALFDLTGKRVRDLPFTRHFDLVI